MESFCRKPDRLTVRLLPKLTLMIMTMTMSIQCVSATPTLHRVGGRPGWAPNVNFTEWSSHKRFYVDDWLIFYFDKTMYSVLEVNKTNYEQCREEDFITNITKGGRDVFELKEARPYYFLSGRGFCWNGMKVAISVQQAPPTPAPAPAPPSSKSASLAGSSSITLLLAFSCAVLFWTVYI